jgi:predicted esterase
MYISNLCKVVLAVLCSLPLGGLALAQEVVDVPGWTYHRYGEEIGLLGNRFVLYVPDNYDPSQTYRIILNSHGAGGNPEETVAGLMGRLNARGIDDVIVMFPHQTVAVGEWRYSHPDLPATQDILAHLQKVRRDFSVYEKAFFTGFSLGGSFTMSFGMFLPDELIAAAPGGGGGSFTEPNGDYFWQGNFAPLPSDSPFTQSGWEMYHPYATAIPPQAYKNIPWLVYDGLEDTTIRVNGGDQFYNALLADGADVSRFVEAGIGHSISTAMHNEIIDLYVDKVQTTNQPPVANAAISLVSGRTIALDAAGSSDPDGSVVRVEWLSGDGTRLTAASSQHTYAEDGTYLVRLRVTDNDNDMATLYRSVTLEGGTLVVNTPPTTYALPVSTPYNTPVSFSVADFEAAIDDPDGDPLQKIRIGIRVSPATGLVESLKGSLTLNGVPVVDGQEIDRADISALIYEPVGNSGEAFFEYNVFDGHSWSPFDTSRVNIAIGDVPASELFTDITPVSGREHATGTLGVGALYFTNEQSAISEVPAELDGVEIIRTHSDDKSLTSQNSLSFTLSEDATIYIAYDGRVTSPPDWLTSGWTFHNDDTLKSWFYFLLYKKDFAAGETVILGGNNAAGTVSQKSMYFVIGVPATPAPEPQAPSLAIEASPGGGLQLTWPGESGLIYTIRSGSDLTDTASWPVVHTVPGVDSTMTHALSQNPAPRQFWIIENSNP